jgi:hypothetical protein
MREVLASGQINARQRRDLHATKGDGAALRVRVLRAA